MNMSNFVSRWKEDMHAFFTNPDREKLREVLKTYDAEHEYLDFKAQWIGHSKLAKHVLGFANSGGGAIVFGVKENDDGTFDAEGLDAFRDKADIAIDQYLPNELESRWEVIEFNYDATEWNPLQGNLYQVMLVDDEPLRLPYFATRDGKNIGADTIYVRDNRKTIEADKAALERLVQRRVNAEISEAPEGLREDLKQLQTLYDSRSGMFSLLSGGLTISSLEGHKAFNKYLESRIAKKNKIRSTKNWVSNAFSIPPS